MTLWAAGGSAPTQLGQAKTGEDGRFTLSADSKGADLYLVAQGGRPQAKKAGGRNPAISLMAVIGGAPPSNVVVNEMTTVASVWTHAQFLDGTAIKGPALSLQNRGRQRAELRRPRNRRLGRSNPRAAQQRPDADHGEFRHSR